MHLDSQAFAEIISGLRGAGLVSGTGKRRAARIALNAQVPVSLVTDGSTGAPSMVAVRDFSSRGIALLYNKALVGGQQFVVELHRLTGRAISLLCTVVHSRLLENGRYSVGAEFTCVLQDDPQLSVENPIEMDRIQRSVLE